MSIEFLLSAIAVSASVSALAVEAYKKICTRAFSNLAAFIISTIIGICLVMIHYFSIGYPPTTQTVAVGILTGLGSGLASMVGYDKVVQMIEQFKR